MHPAILLLLLFVSPVSQAADPGGDIPFTVTVGVNHAPPYRIVAENEVTGRYVEIFETIARQLGWRVQYREAPFRRVLQMMESGHVDIMLGPLKTPEREVFMAFIGPAFPAEQRLFFYRKPENQISSYPDLYGKKIGVLRGSRYSPVFDADPQLEKIAAVRYRNLMLMLQQDHIDVVIAPELVGLHSLGQWGQGISISPFTVPGEPSYIAVSRKSPALAYSGAIRQLLESIQARPALEPAEGSE